MVIASMKPGHFTTGGHFIVLTDYNNDTNQFTVLDPNANNKNWKDDGKITRTDHPGKVYADADMVHSEQKQYFIITCK